MKRTSPAYSRTPREITFTLNEAMLNLTAGTYVLENLDDANIVTPVSDIKNTLPFCVMLEPHDSSVHRVRNQG